MALKEDFENTVSKKPNISRQVSDQSRRRDFIVLALLVFAILVILFVSGSLSLSEVLTACLIFVFAATAYFLSTGNSSVDPATMTGFAAARRDAESEIFQASGSNRGDAFNDVRTIIEAYPQPALLVGLEGRVLATNQGGTDVFRLPRSGGFGSAIIRRADMLRQLEAVANGQTPEPLDIEIAGTPDQYFRVLSQPIRIQGEARVLVVLIELTELRRAEKARADFLANASHELRTPLTSLAGFIETMRGPAKDDPEVWDRFLEIMYGQTERMRRLIHDLLSLSRIELSEHHRPDKTVDFSLLAGESFEAMAPIARERGVALDMVSSTNEAPVFGVRDELAQVLQNLIDNAVKYTRDGTSVLVEVASDLDLEEARVFTARRWPTAARISIVQNRHEPGMRYVAFRVSDEGLGIDRQHLPRLGERFYRVDEGRDRAVGGTGLGLAIVKHIISRHRGGFMVESEEGRGSAFGFWIPMIAHPVDADGQSVDTSSGYAALRSSNTSDAA